MNHSELIKKYLPGRSFEQRGNALLVKADSLEIASVVRLLMASLPFLTMAATDERRGAHKAFCIYYVFGLPAEALAKAGVPNQSEPVYIVPMLALADTTFISLAREFPGLALYEREISTMFGLTPEGHPDHRTLILHEENWPKGSYPLRKDFKWDTKVPETHSGDYRFHKIGGEGIYEIPVGPVHAGIIEPGHFRFSVAGEEIVSFEARFGWVHKGVEKLFENLPAEKKVLLSERISGDSAFSHSLAYCQAIETLTGAKVPTRAQYLRLVFAEIERLTMHIFDIGNIAGNGTGFTFMAAQGFRLVEDLRRLSQTIYGNRFLRGINTPGGVTRDLTPESLAMVRKTLSDIKDDFAEIVNVAEASTSLANRLKGTGTLPAQVVRDYGGTGIAARSNSIAKDARVEYPYGAYREIVPAVMQTTGGDVAARFDLRIKEVFESFRIIDQALLSLPMGPIHSRLPELPKEGMAVGVVEGWRGEIAYVVFTHSGVISRVKVRDPSFIHWQLVSHLSSQDMVPDFPLINKSFDLSYSGNDL